MTHVTCRLTAKIRDQVRKPTFVSPVRATFTFFTLCMPTTVVYNDRHTSVEMGNDKNNGFENFEYDNVKSKVYGCSSSQCNPATPVRELTCHMGSQCYPPSDRGGIPAVTPVEAGTRFSDPGGMHG